MTSEPKKILKNIDLTCFRHIYHPKWEGRAGEIYLMGTTKAFIEVTSFLENQVTMALEFGKATKEFIFRRPWEFDETIAKSKIEGLSWNTRKLSLEFFESMKIRFDTSKNISEVRFINKSVVGT